MLEKLNDYLQDYNYRKHLKLVACVYTPLIAFDLTASYFIIRKLMSKAD